MKSMKRLLSVGLTLAMVAPLAVACTKTEKPQTEEERVLRIATSFGYGPDDEYFRQQFTEVFEFANPNIKIEIIPTTNDPYGKPLESGEKAPDPLEKLKEVMQGDNPPDVVMVDYDQLGDVINSNLLTQLDPLITKDKFDTSDMVPAVIDGLKKAGNGKLYALAPTFSSSALIYNKKLFTDAGANFPKDDMTWDEVFDLAKLVAKGEGDSRINGFSFSTSSQMDLFYGMQTYTAPLELKMFDENGEKMTVDTDQWEQVWSKLAQLQKDNVFPEIFDPSKPMDRKIDQDNPFAYDDFMSGRLAMGIVGYGQISQLINANKNAANYKGYTPIEWDVVTMPSHESAKGVGGSIYMNGIMGINVKAQNQDDAWKFIKFINGEEWARLKSHSSYNLVARKKYLQPKDGEDFHMEAFYNVLPAPSTDNTKLYRELPNLYQVQEIGRQQFQNVLQGKTAVRDALKEWQTQGDAMLKQMRENPTDGGVGVMPLDSVGSSTEVSAVPAAQ
ncbi:sugar ABC transporter substrate-binding protein [Paenibacillus athensensis]|uniref:ABC transporter substrate-binding protein n=1 Tax=Paenibacillus athensensis TaxID=1967502 RepID=A0A4Y8PRV6_9BACL|nr:sugar ABC transporter substrate-binding protein [Paenibacillus athensensis]MCD1261658.1 sugar ABC transporter substrate-binding protein [Paenibacillus athensensis]